MAWVKKKMLICLAIINPLSWGEMLGITRGYTASLLQMVLCLLACLLAILEAISFYTGGFLLLKVTQFTL